MKGLIQNKLTLMSGYIAASLFMMISLLHTYWALGGKRWLEKAIPTEGGQPLFDPPAFVTLLVALAFAAAMLLVLGKMGIWGAGWPQWIFVSGTWALCVIFLLRALMGFWQSDGVDEHAYLELRIFTPFSLFVALICSIVARTKYKADR